MTALLVFVAGGLGSLTRYLIGLAALRALGPRFPSGTLAVNLIGCFLIGALMALVDHRQLDERLRLALVAGFLGGFTTYSAFAYETLALAERRTVGLAALYAALTVVGCFLACAAGLALVRRIA
jgi:fluoride exporter